MITLNRPTNTPEVQFVRPADRSCAEPPPSYTESAPDQDSRPTPPRLLDQMRKRRRVKHYSIHTEEAYLNWVRRYIRFHHKEHPRQLGPAGVEMFLTHLAVDRKVASSAQAQAKGALLFLYGEVLRIELPWLDQS